MLRRNDDDGDVGECGDGNELHDGDVQMPLERWKR
jgi:hypothetical protein